MLFFVWKQPTDNESYTVRRQTANLTSIIEAGVDWRKSVFLNLIVHADFRLTLAVCRQDAESGQLSEPLVKAHSRVYASPATTPLSVDTESRDALAESPLPCWPEISFAVANFEEEFESLQVIGQTDCCFCVLLSLGRSAALAQGVNRKATALMPEQIVFSGLVTYPQLKGAMGPSAGLLSYLFGPKQARKVVMRGPGGRGEAEVAVTALPKARGDGAEQRLRCCLMTLRLPWESVAASILKAIP